MPDTRVHTIHERNGCRGDGYIRSARLAKDINISQKYCGKNKILDDMNFLESRLRHEEKLPYIRDKKGMFFHNIFIQTWMERRQLLLRWSITHNHIKTGKFGRQTLPQSYRKSKIVEHFKTSHLFIHTKKFTQEKEAISHETSC